MITRRTICLLIFIALGLLVAGYVAAASIYPSIGYSVETEFGSLPETDDRLSDWLKTQPGVVSHTVHINRRGEMNNRVYVSFIQSRNLLHQPGFPDLERGCRELGYNAPTGPFRDSR